MSGGSDMSAEGANVERLRRAGAVCAAVLLAGVTLAASSGERLDDPPAYPVGIDFENDVLPALSRAGCNTGECHGAALGQADFKLSLFGYDARADWEAIARELHARRIDVVDPEQSLLLRKASRQIYHGGGRRLAADSEAYALVREWIAEGAPYSTDDRSLTGIELTADDEQTALKVVARYDDGSWRDVTETAIYSSNDDSMVEVTESGELDRWRSGRTSVVARYGGAIEALTVTEAFGEASADFPVANFVDEYTRARFRELGLEPPLAVDDATFLRRVSLDLLGRLPSPEEVLAFESDPDAEALVDRALAHADFAAHWGYRLAELIPERPGVATWLTRQLAADRGWDEIVAEVVTSTGRHPGTALFGSNDPKLMAESLAQGFLGQSIQCAQCHNHPFSTFSRADYFGLAAFFARVRSRDGEVELSTRGELRIPDSSDEVAPAFPGGDLALFASSEDRREALAGWIVEQPDFARSLVNRVWDRMLGVGLVEPLDDLRPSNPGLDPDLLDALAEHLVASDYSLAELVGAIARSQTYRTSKAPRPMSAAVLHDALAQATGVENAASAVREPTLDSALIEVSGPRTRFEGSLAQSLHLLESPELEQKLAAMPRYDLDTLFLRVLGRHPSPAERELEPRSREEYEDLVWALVNSSEFLYVR